MSQINAFGIIAVFAMIACGKAPAMAACDQTCTAVQTILKDRTNNFNNITDNKAPPRYRCEYFIDNYGCRIYDAPQRVAVAAFRSALLGFRKSEPRWRWFRAIHARYQLPGELQIYGGPSRGNFIVNMWIARRGKHSVTDFNINITAWNTMFDVVPCDRSCQ